jgi:hypothetical protein
MRSIFTRSFLGAALTALIATVFASSWATDAHAQSTFFIKKVQLFAQRNSSAADNPHYAVDGQAAYATPVLNGTHGSAVAGVVGTNPTLTDTLQAIDVRDHWGRTLFAYRIAAPPATQVLADTSEFGTLFITSTSGTIDSVWVLRDVSADGFNWTAVDSIPSHIITGSTQHTVVQGADSLGVILSGLSGQSGTALCKAAVTFTYSPWAIPTGVTAQAFRNVNYWRFRVHMSPGDYAAAGANGGLRLEFQYPAVDVNPVQRNMIVPNNQSL